MAFIRLKNGKGVVVNSEQANLIWAIYNKEEPGDDKQQQFCKLVKMIHFNPKNAPESWLKLNKKN